MVIYQKDDMQYMSKKGCERLPMEEERERRDRLAEAVCNQADLLDFYARKLSEQADELRRALGAGPPEGGPGDFEDPDDR